MQARGEIPTCIKQSGEDRIEIYDSQAALDKLARVNGLYDQDSRSEVEIVLIVPDVRDLAYEDLPHMAALKAHEERHGQE